MPESIGVAISMIGRTLTELMKERKLTSAELARLTGVVQPVIYRMASGETDNPKIGTLIPIANYFGISINQLIGFKEPPGNLASCESELKNKKIPLLKWGEVPDWPVVSRDHQYISVDRDMVDSCFALEINGPTMNHSFPDGCIAVFDANLTARNGDFVLVFSKEHKKVALKQFLTDGGDVYLKPLNKELNTVFIDKISTINIRGVLTETRITFRE
jgi:SOS-response transcriptional repressor LexA